MHKAVIMFCILLCSFLINGENDPKNGSTTEEVFPPQMTLSQEQLAYVDTFEESCRESLQMEILDTIDDRENKEDADHYMALIRSSIDECKWNHLYRAAHLGLLPPTVIPR